MSIYMYICIPLSTQEDGGIGSQAFFSLLII